MTEADFQTANPSVRGVCISDLITGRIVAAASLSAVPECADGRTQTGAVDVYAFSRIFWKSWASYRFPDQTIHRPDDYPARHGDDPLSAQRASVILTASPKRLPLIKKRCAAIFRFGL
jgi:hypothetical protein